LPTRQTGWSVSRGWLNDPVVAVFTIRCARCKAKVFKYRKIGKGRVLHCWKDRILEDNSVHSGSEIRCTCGNLIGIDEHKWIRMKRSSFTHSGTVTRK
jgi:hypothetical protein